MPAARERSSKAEQTRAAILQAAESLFAERGFTDTRLEDVAERVGVRRAALFYYFADKRALYAAVVDSVFGGFLARMETLLAREGAVGARIEAAVGAFVDAVADRPTMARLILREAAGARPEGIGPLMARATPLVGTIRQLYAEGRRTGELNPAHPEPLHSMAALAGATVFYVAALPALQPDLSFDPLDATAMRAHRRDLLRIARRLLGLRSPRLVPGVAT